MAPEVRVLEPTIHLVEDHPACLPDVAESGRCSLAAVNALTLRTHVARRAIHDHVYCLARSEMIYQRGRCRRSALNISRVILVAYRTGGSPVLEYQ